MKLLTFVDVHGYESIVKNIIKTAKKENVEALVCAGDLTNFGEYFEKILREFDIGLPLFIIPGNHELPDQLGKADKKFPFVRNLHGRMEIFNDLIFYGCGGSMFTPFNTPYELDEKKFRKLLEIKAEDGRKSIFIVHEPPYNTRLDKLHQWHIGNKAIRDFILKYKPTYCICGHLHENMGKEERLGDTIIINPGPYGKIINL